MSEKKGHLRNAWKLRIGGKKGRVVGTDEENSENRKMTGGQSVEGKIRKAEEKRRRGGDKQTYN